MSYGPIELVVAHFPGSQFDGSILPELQKLVQNDIVRIVDMAIVVKEIDGSISALEISDLPGAESSILSEIVSENGGLISDEDFIAFGEGLQPGSTAALMMFENVWAAPFVQAVRNAQGEFIFNERIPRFIIDELVASRDPE